MPRAVRVCRSNATDPQRTLAGPKSGSAAGPHQTWRWMNTQEFRAAFPRDRELYDWLRHYRQALDAHPHRPRGYWAKVKNAGCRGDHAEAKTNSARTPSLRS